MLFSNNFRIKAYYHTLGHICKLFSRCKNIYRIGLALYALEILHPKLIVYSGDPNTGGPNNRFNQLTDAFYFAIQTVLVPYNF
jgi:hypothetical protein